MTVYLRSQAWRTSSRVMLCCPRRRFVLASGPLVASFPERCQRLFFGHSRIICRPLEPARLHLCWPLLITNWICVNVCQNH